MDVTKPAPNQHVFITFGTILLYQMPMRKYVHGYIERCRKGEVTGEFPRSFGNLA